jgi:hypothetical protein
MLVILLHITYFLHCIGRGYNLCTLLPWWSLCLVCTYEQCNLLEHRNTNCHLNRMLGCMEIYVLMLIKFTLSPGCLYLWNQQWVLTAISACLPKVLTVQTAWFMMATSVPQHVTMCLRRDTASKQLVSMEVYHSFSTLFGLVHVHWSQCLLGPDNLYCLKLCIFTYYCIYWVQIFFLRVGYT